MPTVDLDTFTDVTVVDNAGMVWSGAHLGSGTDDGGNGSSAVHGLVDVSDIPAFAEVTAIEARITGSAAVDAAISGVIESFGDAYDGGDGFTLTGPVLQESWGPLSTTGVIPLVSAAVLATLRIGFKARTVAGE